MEDPTKTNIEKPDTIKERFIRKIENEPNLKFIDALIEKFPDMKIYLVGGIVRDTLVGEHVKSKDYDFIICGVPHPELEKAMTGLGHWTYAGSNFGVYKFRPHDFTLKYDFDIALPRREQPHGTGKRADVDVQSDYTMKVEDDLGRRDLTINAMAWDIKNQKLVDPYHGQKDLKNKVVRSVGNPLERFTEDRSRMFRAIRFSCKFNFEIDLFTYEAIESFMPRVNETIVIQDEKTGKEKEVRITPMDTIRIEMFKALAANPAKAFRLLEKTGAWHEILPELDALRNKTTLWKRLQTTLELLTKENLSQELTEEYDLNISNHDETGDFIFAIILYHIKLALPEPPTTTTKKAARRADPIQQILERINLSRKEKDKATWLLTNIDTITTKLPDNLAEQEQLLDHQHTQDALTLALIIHQTDQQIDDHLQYENQKDAINRFATLFDDSGELPAPFLTGRDVMQALGLDKGGPIINELLQKLRHLQLAKEIKTKTEAIDWISSQ